MLIYVYDKKIEGDVFVYDRLTRKDVEKMKKEVEERKLVVRKQAKQFKNRNESRIRYLEKMIKTAKIIEDDSDESQVGLNDSVTIYIEEDDMEECFKIVTTIRSDAINNMVSIESPIGRSLMKHKVGDRVYIKINDSDGYYAVIRNIDKSDDESEKISSY